MFFHNMAMVENDIQVKALKYSRSYFMWSLLMYTVQKLLIACTALAEAANLAPLKKLVSPSILFDLEKKQFLVLRKKEQRFSTREQSQHLLLGKGAVKNEVDMDNRMWDRSS